MSTALRNSRRLTVDDYYRLGESGVFTDRRVELIDGEIADMLPLGYRHVVSLSKTEETLRTAFGKRFWIRTQVPLRFDRHNEPLPDVSVVRGTAADFTDHPTTAALVVEISDSTLRFDVGEKASLYAWANIEDYWVLDLKKDVLRIFRKRAIDKKQKYGYRYESVVTLEPSQRVTTLARPKAQILVADLLP